MATEEFDRYLAELRQQLRLTAPEGDSITAELEQHLEQQFSDLIAAGFSKQEAIAQCLSDFGQVDQLAERLTTANRWRQKREANLMMTVAAACFFGSLFLAYCWAPAAPPIRLTLPMSDLTKQTNPQPSLPVRSDEAVLHQLDQCYAGVVPGNLPLDSFVHQLLGLSDIEYQFRLDPSLPNLSTHPSPAWALPNVRLRTALEIVLPSMGLSYQIQNGILLIGTPNLMSSQLSRRCYPLHVLNQNPLTPEEGKKLIDAVCAIIEPNTWHASTNPTGKCRINRIRDQLIVTQRENGHQQLRLLLAELGARGSP